MKYKLLLLSPLFLLLISGCTQTDALSTKRTSNRMRASTVAEEQAAPLGTSPENETSKNTEPATAAGLEIKNYLYHYVTLQSHAGPVTAKDIVNLNKPDQKENYYRYEVFFEFPQLQGMADQEQENKLNRLLKPAITDFLRENPLLLTSYIDSSNTRQVIYTSDNQFKVKTHRKLSDAEMPRQLLSHTYTTTLDAWHGPYVSLTFSEVTEGNVLAHPSFSQNSVVLHLEKGETVMLKSLLKGNFLEALKKEMQKIAIVGEPEAGICGEGKVKQSWIESIDEETYVAALTKTHLYLRADTRDFGCPEVARGMLEAAVPLSSLDL